MNSIVLKDGMYLITVSKPGYVSYDTLITLRTGDQPFFWFTLKPKRWLESQELVALEGTARAAQDEIRVEESGSSTDRREFDLSQNVAPEVLVSRPSATDVPVASPPRPDRTQQERSVPSENESQQEERIDYIPEDTATAAERSPVEQSHMDEEVGTLSILVRPWGAIYVNGELHLSNTDVVYTLDLAPGEHSIRAVHPTLGESERSVRIDPATTQRVVIDLGHSRR